MENSTVEEVLDRMFGRAHGVIVFNGEIRFSVFYESSPLMHEDITIDGRHYTVISIEGDRDDDRYSQVTLAGGDTYRSAGEGCVGCIYGGQCSFGAPPCSPNPGCYRCPNRNDKWGEELCRACSIAGSKIEGANLPEGLRK